MRDLSAEAGYQELRATALAARGFSAVFWALPVAVVLSVRATMSEWASRTDLLVSFAAYLVIFYGLLLIDRLPTLPTRSGWKRTLWRSAYFCFVCIGLAPFAFFWNRQPESAFFELNVLLHGFALVGFILCYNKALARLNEQVIDPGLQVEVAFLARFNRGSLVTVAFMAFGYLGAVETLTPEELREPTHRRFTPLVLTGALMTIILPVSMTMNLTWKFKDAIFAWIYRYRLVQTASELPNEPAPTPSQHPDEEVDQPWA